MSNPLDFDPLYGQVWGSSETTESLRDRFAMAALTGYLANKRGFNCQWDAMADNCYRVADAMLAQRLKPPVSE